MVSAQPEAFEGQWPQRPIKGMARKSTQQHYDRKHTHTHREQIALKLRQQSRSHRAHCGRLARNASNNYDKGLARTLFVCNSA